MHCTTAGGSQPQSAFWSIVCVTNGGTGARPALDGLDATAYPSGTVCLWRMRELGIYFRKIMHR